MGKGFILFLLASVLLVACRFNPNYQGKGANRIQGQWEEVPQAIKMNYYNTPNINFALHAIRFM
jgi:hypothetical protein